MHGGKAWMGPCLSVDGKKVTLLLAFNAGNRIAGGL